MLKDKDGRLDATDRLDELENAFEIIAAMQTTKNSERVEKASALAMLSLAIDSVQEVIADRERAEETENLALKVNVSN